MKTSELNICEHCRQWIAVDNSGLSATDIAKLKVTQLEAENQRLREALTDNGKLNWYHMETWANQIEAEQRYQSRLTQWLFEISKAMKALENATQ